MKTLLYIILAAVAPLAALQRRAESGDPEALYRLALVYERGFDTIPADSVRSVVLLHAAADRDFAPAQNYLGFLFGKGVGVPQNNDSAIFWIKRAADVGDPKAANNLAFLLLNDNHSDSCSVCSSSADTLGKLCPGRASRDSLAATYLIRAAETGLPTALTTLGTLFAQGRGVNPDTIRATKLFEAAISRGFHDAELHLLNLRGPYWNTLAPALKLELADHYFELGSPLIATDLLASVVPDSLPPVITDSLSAKAMESPISGLTRSEAAHAYNILAKAHSIGAGVNYDHSRANRYFAIAAALGDPEAEKIFNETIQIFPDILSSLFSPDELLTLRSYSDTRPTDSIIDFN